MLNNKQPATRADLNEVKTELNGKIDLVRADLNEVKTELNGKIDSVKNELKDDFKRVSIDLVKLQTKVERIEERMATKDDMSRIMNSIDKFASEFISYRNRDILRGDEIMKHTELLQNHETRLEKLETK